MDYNKVKSFCSKFRMALGVALVAVAIITGNPWFYLGIIVFVAGLSKFCPLCLITKQCDLPESKPTEKENNNESN